MEDSERPTTDSIAPGAITALLRDAFRARRERSTALPVFQPGQVIGRFELVRKLGHGGFGVVYEAFDQALKRAVAFKALRLGGDLQEKEEQLLREAEAAAQLSHPNIVTLHDIGQCGQGPYLVMELLRGRTVGERLREGPIPLSEALGIGVQVARGIAHAHARRIVHRDVTPGNVFLCDDGQVKVLDFGMAAFGRDKVEGGTVAYMAPEQWSGATEDERTDVFALGVVLYEMISGRRPFQAPEELKSADPAPHLDARLGPVSDAVARMLEKDPRRRPRDCGEVLAELTSIQQAATPPAAGPVAARARRPSRRTAVVAVTLVAAAALAALLARGRVGRAVATAERNPHPPAAPAAASPARAAQGETAQAPDPPAAPREAVRDPPRPTPPRRAPSVAPGAVRYCRGSIASVETPPPESGDGVITVVAEPYAAVFVDGVPYGETPSECRVSAGTHAVRAVHPRFGARETHVRVLPGARATWTADFPGDR